MNSDGIEKLFFPDLKKVMTLLSLQLMTNRQNKYDCLTEGRSLTFFLLHRLDTWLFTYTIALTGLK